MNLRAADFLKALFTSPEPDCPEKFANNGSVINLRLIRLIRMQKYAPNAKEN